MEDHSIMSPHFSYEIAKNEVYHLNQAGASTGSIHAQIVT